MGLRAEQCRFRNDLDSVGVHEVNAQIRYRHKGVSAQLIAKGKSVELMFEEPLSAVTPGQAVVFYRDDEVIGGGWIEEALNTPLHNAEEELSKIMRDVGARKEH